jgi:hypothetical protein
LLDSSHNTQDADGSPRKRKSTWLNSKYSLLIKSIHVLKWTPLEGVAHQSTGDNAPPSSGGSGDESDYGDSRAEALKKRALRHSRGRSVSDPEDEDQEAEDEMNSEVVPESGTRGHRGVPKVQGKPFPTKEKGKQRATNPTDSGAGDEGSDNNIDRDDNSDDNDNGNSHVGYVTGPLSDEAQEEVRQLGEETKGHVNDLARKYRKSPGIIMRMAGLAVQNARQRENIANKHRSWYSHYHPKPETSEQISAFPYL